MKNRVFEFQVGEDVLYYGHEGIVLRKYHKRPPYKRFDLFRATDYDTLNKRWYKIQFKNLTTLIPEDELIHYTPGLVLENTPSAALGVVLSQTFP